MLLNLLATLFFFSLSTFCSESPGLAQGLAQEESVQLRTMTFNIRYGLAKDGENRWENRKDLVAHVIRESNADVIGLQEAYRFQLDDLRQRLPQFGEIGEGREGGEKGEYSAILFRKERFQPQESGTFWLSETPDKISAHWGNELVRICTWARLLDRHSGQSFYVFNTHFDHQSQNARIRSARLIAQRIQQRRHADPFLLMGDFNAGEDNPVVRYLKGEPVEGIGKSPLPLVDTFRVRHPQEKTVGTFSGFSGRTGGPKIDHIFVPPSIQTLESAILRVNRNGRLPSDHYPVTARIALPGPAASDASGPSTPLPNIVIIYADDLGYGDLSCYNPKSAYRTPRLDQLASEGIRFTDAHSPSTICSPSRYGLYSGQQIYRSTGRGGGAFEGPGGPSYLKPGTLTLGQMLQSKGYRTGVFGKWHVGLTWFDKDGQRLGGGFKNSLLIDYPKSTPLIDGPNQRGFDESFVTPNCPTTDPLYVYIENGMVPVPASERHQRKNLPNPGGKWRWDNDEGWMSPGYEFVNADLLFYEKTRQFITGHVEQHPRQPFLAVLSTQVAHAPVLPAEEFNGISGAGPRGDFVVELDTLVGRVVDLLDELGIGDNTLLLFNADNGAETVHVDWMRQDHDHDASGGWRGMKRDGWEGGHRVPMIARWPRYIPAGQVSGQLTNTTDIFATLASVVGYPLDENDARDSFDMLPVMIGQQDESQPVRPHMLTQSFRGEFQIRQGDWKFLDHQGSGGNNYSRGALQKYALPEQAPEAAGQLYNLKDDPGETTNRYFTDEAKRTELQELLTQLKQSGRSAPRKRKPLGVENLNRLDGR